MQVGSVEGGGTTTRPQSYRFTDGNLPYEADTLQYRLRQVDTDGAAEVTDPIGLTLTARDLLLGKPFPNPAAGEVTVRLARPERGEVTLRLYDALGRQVRALKEGPLQGREQIQIDVSRLPSGTYFLRMQAGGRVQTEPVTVVK